MMTMGMQDTLVRFHNTRLIKLCAFAYLLVRTIHRMQLDFSKFWPDEFRLPSQRS